jgi:hypothetical protein
VRHYIFSLLPARIKPLSQRLDVSFSFRISAFLQKSFQLGDGIYFIEYELPHITGYQVICHH